MKAETILTQASMPIASPSYPRGPYRFIDREYFIVAYQSDPEAIREAVPEPLKPDPSRVKGAWSGPARLHLVPHVNAPVADLPVVKVLEGTHFVADLTLPYGRVIHDYLAEATGEISYARTA